MSGDDLLDQNGAYEEGMPSTQDAFGYIPKELHPILKKLGLTGFKKATFKKVAGKWQQVEANKLPDISLWD